ncbi:MAG: aldehyde dehydrogenase [Actinobacteria bacterium]|nr:aldehyde dehydrogenase [Actinomycetota bacterium]MBI3686113.1 aldehyde dehydrogenase [Actinomycetota bacterium]
MDGERAATGDATSVDAALASLRGAAPAWSGTGLAERIDLLDRLSARVLAEADGMVAAAALAKGYPADSLWAAEDWSGGPWALLQHIDGYRRALRRIAAGGAPIAAGAVHRDGDGRTAVDVFPASGWDRLLLNGLSARVRLRPGVTPEQALASAGGAYRGQRPNPGVAAVLGAGNVAAITPLDVLHKLYSEGQVVAGKLNPVNGYLSPLLRRIFADFVAAGWVRFLDGGPEIGHYLVHHPDVDAVHLTGSAHTHDAIVWGTGAEAQRRRREGTPLLAKPISSELGGVSPCIVVPGRWSAADLRFQAELIVTSKLNNSGHNCIATQVIVLPEGWPGGPRLLAEIRNVLAGLPGRPGYYPGTDRRLRAVREAYPDAESLGPDGSWLLVPELAGTAGTAGDPGTGPLVCEEVFGTALGVVRLPAATTADYLRRAVDFANDQLPGTLGATVLIDPRTGRRERRAVTAAVHALRFGTVGINVWSGVGFLLGATPWGAYPGHDLAEIGSGVGTAHNTFLLADVEQTVLRGPFAPFPRGLVTGAPSLSPRPPYFVGNRTSLTTVRRITRFAARPSARQVPAIFASALRG